MLTSYMDETGHSASSSLHFVGMAGFVASIEAWNFFEKKWKEVLEIFNVDTFHAKKFAHSKKPFDGWNETKRRLFYYGLVSTIAEIRPIPIGGLVSLEEFRSLTAMQQSNFKDPYYLAFQNATRGAAVQTMFLEESEKVAMVYAYNREFGALPPQEVYSVDQAGKAEQLWQVMKATTDFGRGMGSYSSSTPGKTVQLQAADLFAYELGKEFENQILRPQEKMRWAMRHIVRLMDLPNHFIHLFGRKELLRIIKESKWPDQTGVEEVGDSDQQMIEARNYMTQLLLKRAGIVKS